MGGRALLFLALCVGAITAQDDIDHRKFPEGFKFGVATASYQVEGAWNEDGKGENIWDHLCHTTPDRIDDLSSGDVACDSYHKYQEDVAIIKNLGVNFYRFSLSWSRLLPDGTINQINQAGVDYYNNLIDELLANDIEPLVTLFHWDLPQPLQDIGGFINGSIVDNFADYARFAFKQYGDRVKSWLTFNEPKQTCQQGYGDGSMAPSISESGVLDYQCTYHLLLAHAAAYHIYDDEFRATQNGRISITIDTTFQEPASDTPEDLEAAERALQFIYGWYANPVYLGNWPQVMIDRVGARSAMEGFAESRLPAFTPEQVAFINQTFDFMGVNIYTTNYAAWQADPPIGDVSYYNDLSILNTVDPSWPSSASSWLKVVPWGAKNLLLWLKKTYNDPEIIITENGFSDLGDSDDLQDYGRINYYQTYLSNILQAILDDGVRVTGYTAWSLMDNFEWERGYTQRFGLHYVNFTDPERTRTPKASAEFYKNLVATRCLVDQCLE